MRAARPALLIPESLVRRVLRRLAHDAGRRIKVERGLVGDLASFLCGRHLRTELDIIGVVHEVETLALLVVLRFCLCLYLFF